MSRALYLRRYVAHCEDVNRTRVGADRQELGVDIKLEVEHVRRLGPSSEFCQAFSGAGAPNPN